MRIAILGIRGIPAKYGGFETNVEEVSERLVKKGFEVTVYCRKHNVRIKEKVYKGINLVKLPSINNKYLDTISHTFLSVSHALFKKYDIIHLFGVGNSVFLLPLRFFGKKVIISVDGLDWRRKKWNKLASFIFSLSPFFAVHLARKVIVDSQEVGKYYLSKYKKPTDYIPYGAYIEKDEDADALKKYHLERNRYLLFVGRLEPEKGVHYLIKAYERLKTDLKLVIIGDNLYNRDYVESLKRTKNSNINFLGFIYGEHYKQLCSHAYLYIQPSDLEGTSPALLAAMGFGNCVLVSDIPENIETIGQAGLSFKSGSIDDLSKKMEYLLNNEKIVREYKQRASERVKNVYNWDKIADRHEEIYYSLLKGSKNK